MAGTRPGGNAAEGLFSFARLDESEPAPSPASEARTASPGAGIFSRWLSRVTPYGSKAAGQQSDGASGSSATSAPNARRFSSTPARSSPLAAAQSSDRANSTETRSTGSEARSTGSESGSTFSGSSTQTAMPEARETVSAIGFNRPRHDSEAASTTSFGGSSPQSSILSPSVHRAGSGRVVFGRQGPGSSPQRVSTSRADSASDLLSRRYWMSDESAKECYDCKQSFTAFNRRHHCRICGLIFCSKCSSNFVPGQPFGSERDVRACNYCANRLSMPTDSPIATPRPLSTTESLLFAPHMLEAAVNAIAGIPFRQGSRVSGDLATTPTEASPVAAGMGRLFGVRSSPSINEPVPSGSAEPGLRSSQPETASINPPDGPDLAVPSSPDRHSSPALVVPSSSFDVSDSDADDEWNYGLDPVGRAPSKRSLRSEGGASPPPGLDGVRAQFMRQRSRRTVSGKARVAVGKDVWEARNRSASPGSRRTAVPRTFHELDVAGTSGAHLRKMIRQILSESQIVESEGWDDIIFRFSTEVARRVNLDVSAGDDPDIRQYVKVKRIPGGSPSGCEYVSGIVISKAVAHKSMVKRIRNPRILLLSFPLEYERVENQFVSLERVLAQEREHLGNLVARIRATEPDVLLVSRSVSRLASDFLREAGIAVASNVRLEVLEAIARATQADVVRSIDRLAFNPQLGTCSAFEARYYAMPDGKRKGYLWFEGCPPHLGCTIVLRGGDLDKLTRIKQAVTLMCLVVHSLRLEMSLVNDQYAMMVPATGADDATAAADSDDKADLASLAMEQADAAENSSVHVGTVDGSRAKLASNLGGSHAAGPPSLRTLALAVEDAAAIRRYFAYSGVIISGSPNVRFPPPYPLRRRLWECLGHLAISRDTELSESLVARVLRLDHFEVIAPADTEQLSPFAHQNLAILAYLICPGNPVPCQAPEIVSVDYYGATDLTIGQLVQGMCAQAAIRCATKGCDKPYLAHSRAFVHGRGQVGMQVEKRPCPIRGLENSMLMWSQCRICNKSTPCIAMGEDTWKFSTGKYLELTFYSAGLHCRADLCPHDVQRDHARFVAYRNLAVRFEYAPILTFELATPPLRVQFDDDVKMRLKSQDMSSLKQTIVRFHDAMLDRLKSVAVGDTTVAPAKLQACRDDLAELQRKVVVEKNQLLDLLQSTFSASSPSDTLAINAVQRSFVARFKEWDAEFQNFGKTYLQPEAKDLRRMTLRRVFGDDRDTTPPTTPSTIPEALSSSAGDDPSRGMPGVGESPKMVHRQSTDWQGSRNERAVDLDLGSPVLGLSYAADPDVDEASDSETQDRGYDLDGVTLPRPPVRANSLEEYGDSALLAPETKDTSPATSVSPWSAYDIARTTDEDGAPGVNELSGVVTGDSQDATANASQEKASLFQTVAALWTGATATWQPLVNPFPPTEHVLPDSLVVIREDEPSSLIAYSLSTREYKMRLDLLKEAGSAQNMASGKEGQPMKPVGPKASVPDSPKDVGVALEDMLLKAAGHNMRIETSDGATAMMCKIFYAEQFDALREACGVDPAAYVSSLARCLKWESAGGKSGSTFMKTRDERFIMKELPKPEMEAFLQLAPQYFRYVSQSLFHSLPSAIAKIFGLYRVKFKNPAGKIVKLDVAVMENLWFGRKVTRVFDLKGSLRNRMVASTGKENEVLLDENLIEMMYKEPFFLHPTDKSLLRASLQNDTLFFTKCNIMDYSLLVGVDHASSQLVVGVVDYIRTFTWDKKLESWVKETGILGGGRDPTIVGPRLYRSRFREAMEKYFLGVPDKWTPVPAGTRNLLS
ncbi:hypothetical protein DFJ74DRAFT_663537 [Hyaloraphidium curvatum]|nr:hypothetical protein DFJ74DRAFT_663537 [Hyaloraphidium curvatum]